MIGAALRVEIERYAREMREENPLFVKAADGSLDRETIGRYLRNIHYMLGRTPPNLSRAIERARANGDEALAAHYEHKIDEEIGHDKWAERDMERVSDIRELAPAPQILPSMLALNSFHESMIDKDPATYLAYILFSEYLIVVLGPEWLQLLEERCGIPRTSMTAIGNHIELDKGHVEEALDEIDRLVGDPAKLPAMRAALRDSITHFERFCAEVTEAHHEQRPARRHLALAATA